MQNFFINVTPGGQAVTLETLDGKSVLEKEYAKKVIGGWILQVAEQEGTPKANVSISISSTI